jgi:hypothetical protein
VTQSSKKDVNRTIEENIIKQYVANYFNKRWLKRHSSSDKVPNFFDFEKVGSYVFQEDTFICKKSQNVMSPLIGYSLNTEIRQNESKNIVLFLGNPFDFKIKSKGDISEYEIKRVFNLLSNTRRVIAYSQSGYGDDLFTGTINPDVYKNQFVRQSRITIPKIKMYDGNFFSVNESPIEDNKKLVKCINRVLLEHSESFPPSESRFSRIPHISYNTAITAYNAINGRYQELIF